LKRRRLRPGIGRLVLRILCLVVHVLLSGRLGGCIQDSQELGSTDDLEISQSGITCDSMQVLVAGDQVVDSPSQRRGEDWIVFGVTQFQRQLRTRLDAMCGGQSGEEIANYLWCQRVASENPRAGKDVE